MNGKPTAPRLLWASLLLAAAAAISPAASAQPAEAHPQPPAHAADTPANAEAPQIPEELQPHFKLGARAEAVRRNIKVSPTVVLVSSPGDFVKVLSAWTLGARFPILIDDRTDAARENIARFVRAFEPEAVLRFAPGPGSPEAAPFPADPTQQRNAVNGAFLRAWGAASGKELEEVWAKARFTPPGVVVASIADPAWPAALAIGAGRGEPIVWVETAPRPAGGIATLEEVDSLQNSITGAMAAMNPPGGWRELGDDLDAVTLCLNFPSRFPAEKGENALTDRIGRRDNGARYGWCGQIFGDEQASLYRAMCGLFLQGRSAWLFDGYKPDFAEPYHLGKSIEILEKSGFRVATNPPPHGSLDAWRQRTRFGVSAEFIHVNSSGLARWFDLAPGRATYADVPLLARPAVVHFIHSFSAQSASDPMTIAGRWLANGAYAYYGSVAEPYLSAFNPAPIVAARLLAGMPFGAAVRIDGGREWKLNVYADPLLTYGPPAPRLDAPLQFPSSERLDDHMRAALAKKDVATGVLDLVLLGRDADAARLAQAAAKEGALSPELARAAFPAAVRRSDAPLAYDLFGALSAPDRQDRLRIDVLWQVARPDLASTQDGRILSWLRAVPRPDSLVDDAEALAPALARLLGPPAAREYLVNAGSKATDDKAQKRLAEMAAGY